MRAWIVAALLLVTAACGAYQFPGGSASPSPDTGTVSGHVVSIPCAPVERIDSPCPGRPVAKLEIDYLAGTTVVTKTVTNSTGGYAVQLQPGTYVVRMKTYMRVISGPLKLTVESGSNLVADYKLDSGIRVPVPQQ
jgi:hypothetical protein